MNVYDDEGSEPDIGWTLPTPEEYAARQRESEAWWSKYKAQPRIRAVIELEGPGLEGLQDAENMLFMAGYPPHSLSERLSGSYTDPELLVTCKWRIER